MKELQSSNQEEKQGKRQELVIVIYVTVLMEDIKQLGITFGNISLRKSIKQL